MLESQDIIVSGRRRLSYLGIRRMLRSLAWRVCERPISPSCFIRQPKRSATHVLLINLGLGLWLACDFRAHCPFRKLALYKFQIEPVHNTVAVDIGTYVISAITKF